jgi:ubiquinone/menaquinone biosynthesis C-methylase UbiE
VIILFDYDKSLEHIAEMTAWVEIVKKDTSWHKETLDSYSELDQFYAGYFSDVTGDEFARATQRIIDGPPLRILDVGPGRGETSLYLADHGHEVFPVEPSLVSCEVIEHAGLRFGKNLLIYNCSAEHLEVPDAQFDVVVFNRSLHHCDDPVKALKNMHRYLRPAGKLFVISEPMLPFYKNAARLLETMNKDPDEYGHYGGNEHLYHFAEYISMIKQGGFRNLRWDPVSRYHSKDLLARSLVNDPRHSRLRKNMKYLYLNLVYSLGRSGLKPLLAILRQLSLLQMTFTATK